MDFEIRDIDKDNKAYKAYLNLELTKGLLEKVLEGKGSGFNTTGFELIKDDKGHEVFKFKFNGQLYYLKYYSNQRLKKRVKNIFRSVEGVRYFETSRKLIKVSIPVVKPVLAIKSKVAFFNTASAFITKGINANTISDFFKNHKYDRKLKESLIKDLALLFAKLYKNNFEPGDPNLENILIDIELGYKLVLVDVDNIAKYPFLPKFMILRNLGKFNALAYKNEEEWSSEDRELFIKTCLKTLGYNNNLEEDMKYINGWMNKKLIKWS